MGKKTLNRYYNKTDHSDIFRIAMGMFSIVFLTYSLARNTVLHPRHKLQYFKDAQWEQEWIDVAKRIVREEFDRSYNHISVEEVPMPHPVSFKIDYIFRDTYCFEPFD